MKGKVVTMPSTMVLKRGTLRGMGRKISCELLLRKQPLPGPRRFDIGQYTYTEWTILRPPRNLPDGDYTLTTEDGFSFAAVKFNGRWMRGTLYRESA